MSPKYSWITLLILAPIGAQQVAPTSLQPAVNELNRDTPVPLMQTNSRIQQFYEIAELGTSGTLIPLSAISLRFDGPTSGPATTHTMESVTIRCGATHRGIEDIDAVFETNLTLPLRTVFTATDYTYTTDANATGSPEVWGGINGELHFPFHWPWFVWVPPGGSLVFDITVRGNTNGATLDPARLDFYVEDSAVAIHGMAYGSGFPCLGVANAPTLDTTGQYEPGTAFKVTGDGYEPGALVVELLTADLLQTQVMIPGTPGCYIYVDLATGGIGEVFTADPTGKIGGAIPLPKAPELCGAVLYLQNVGVVQPTPQNPTGVETSGYRTVVVGCHQPPVTRGWHVSTEDPDSKVGSNSVAGGLAIKIQ